MKFLKSGNAWSLTPDGRMDVRDNLPVGNYTVCRHPITGEYFLEESESFILPKKLYGKTERHGERILRTFETRQPGSQVGVFLSGLKGSGKTLLAKFIAQQSVLPVIIVNAPFADDRFMRTIQGIEQPAVILFDEFEKLYDHDSQESILTLFDGVYTARNKIMIITCNDKYAVRDYFHNRPSRLRYSIAFDRLEAEFIDEYCHDRLDDCDDYLDKILSLSAACDGFNFDMLQTLVDELNRYGGDFDEAVEILNVKPVGDRRSRWNVRVVTPDENDRKWEVDRPTSFQFAPMTAMQRNDGTIYLSIHEAMQRSKAKSSPALSIDDEEESLAWDEDDNESGISLEINSEHLFKVDPYVGIYVFEVIDDGIKFHVIFTEERKDNNTSYNIGRIDY